MFPLHPHDPPSVGPYRLHARIGEDAYARVYLGSVPGEASVAVKVVRSEYATDQHFRAAFSHLVESAYRLDSRHVCDVRAADLSGAVPWVAVARPPGPGLADHVREHGPLPADALHALALAMAQGLADLHSQDRTHGSLWPAGVVLSEDTALLADPGLEWAVSDTEQRAPHPSFAAPEGGSGPATDVFSWAATLSFAASGVEGPPGLPRVPLQLRGLVDACLRRGPSLRPSAADLVGMLGGPAEPAPWPPEVRASVEEVGARQREAVAGGERPRGEGAPEGRGPGSTPDGNGRRVLAVTAAGLALATVAGLSVWGYRELSGDGEPPEGAADAVGADGLVTDGGCLDGDGFPPSGEAPDGERVSAWNTAFSPDGDFLAVTTAEHGLTVWDWRTGEQVAQPAPDVAYKVAPVFAPTGCTVAAGVPTAYEDQGDLEVTVATTFDLAAGSAAEHLGAQNGPADAGGSWPARPRNAEYVAFSPDGSLLAVTLTRSMGADSVAVVDTATGEQAATLVEAPAHNTAFVDSGRVATNDRGTITVWDAADGEELHNVRGTSEQLFAVVPESDEVVYFDGDRIVWWDYAERSEVTSFRISGFAEAEAPVPTDLTLDPEGGRVYVSWLPLEEGLPDDESEYVSHVFDVETGEDLSAGNENATTFQKVSVHPDGEVLAAVTPEERVVLVDPETLEVVEPLF